MKRDNIIFDIIEKEHQRQLKGIELIASENFVSDQVMEATGSCLTNKYAEGYPGKRYYGGCEVVDQSETIAIDRLKKIFHAEWANVQPHSGAQANAAVLLAVLNPGDTFLGLNLAFVSWIGSEQLGHLVPCDSLQCEGRHGTCRLRPNGRDGVERETEVDNRRRLCLFPRLGLQADARDRRRGGGFVDD